MGIDINIRLVPIPGIPKLAPTSPLGLLAPLGGKWKGNGFNQIFRPFNSPVSDNFLELNLTNETLEFTQIPGEIPNRGFVQPDISLFGMTYLQQVTDANVKDTNGNPAGIHIEPGIWINIPSTTNPAEQATVARLANIPHGTSLVAQGTATVIAGPPVFPQPVFPLPPPAPPPPPATMITPFTLNQNQPPGFGKFIPFQSTNLSIPSQFRSPPSDIVGINQVMVDQPNSLLQAFLTGKTINSHTLMEISTASTATALPDPVDGVTTINAGGGISDIAFLEGTGNAPNAKVPQMTARFWISDFSDAQGSGTILQYSQRVLLFFNGLFWPHVSVANLVKQPVIKIKDIADKVVIKEIKDKPEIKEIKDHKAEIKEFDGPVPQPDPGPAGPAAAAPAQGRHFILPAERPPVGDASTKEPPEQPRKKS